MHPAYGMPGQLPMGYSQQRLYLDDYSAQQMALSQQAQAARRSSRGSNGQRAGAAMRVVKPTSANNSPRSTAMASRRRTMMNDGNMARRQQQVLDYLNTTYGYENPQRPSRPLSWHPSTQIAIPGGNISYQHHQQQQQQQQHTPSSQLLSTPNMYGDYQDMYFATGTQYSPLDDSYSTNTSPCSTFSPLPSAFPPLEASQYFPNMDDGWANSQTGNSGGVYSRSTESQAFPELVPSGNSSAPNHTPSGDWNSFIMRGFSNTSPPTPETFLQPQPQQSVPVPEAAVPYQPLEEPAEEEGEILVGMGLYDTPEKHDEDPQLNNYRSTVSSLLGSTFLPMEPRGKGLKLEETWEPPKSDDEDEDGEDAEGEEQEVAAGTA
ncbi:hypothetical protein K4F52_004234 [Lecanicillium sp. MT-2017a]|nr:hypothetical protein K4F52_004234 [Lecanicillium sp. MT-2017a]